MNPEDDEVGTIISLTERRERDLMADVAPIPGIEHLTELGFAQRIVRHHGVDLRYCHPWHRWAVWDGRRWPQDSTAEVWRRAQQTVRTIYAEAAGAKGEAARRAIAAFATKCEERRRQAAGLELAATLDGVPILPEAFDRHDMLLNVRNGTLDLRTARLRPHRREDLITRIADVEFDAEAESPRWDAFLERVLPDPDVRAFLQRYAGYSLTGSTREQVLVVLWGGGANGKSTLLETLREVVGEYGQHAPADTILAKRDTGIPNDVARLRGARLVTIVETEDGRRLAEAQVKMLTGGDTITARHMRSEWFEFKPTAKYWLASNHRPQIRGTDYAMWRRIRLVPFVVQIPETERDPELPAKLRAELPGILRWAVDGCIDWQQHGLRAPTAVQAATAEYRAHEDLLGSWIDERCVLSPHARYEASALYGDYRQWCERAGEHAITQRAFGDRLAERGHDTTRSTGGRKFRLGIGLAAQETSE